MLLPLEIWFSLSFLESSWPMATNREWVFKSRCKIHIHELSSEVRWKENIWLTLLPWKKLSDLTMKMCYFLQSFTSYVGKPFFFCTSCLNWIDGPMVHQLLQARSWRLRRQRFRAAELRSAQLSRESGNAASRGEIDPRYQWKMESNSNSGRKNWGKKTSTVILTDINQRY